ncbi:MAG: hypothetical protein AB7W16_07130 [Candidatus Obscuribacterales bacterium]
MADGAGPKPGNSNNDESYRMFFPRDARDAHDNHDEDYSMDERVGMSLEADSHNEPVATKVARVEAAEPQAPAVDKVPGSEDRQRLNVFDEKVGRAHKVLDEKMQEATGDRDRTKTPLRQSQVKALENSDQIGQATSLLLAAPEGARAGFERQVSQLDIESASIKRSQRDSIAGVTDKTRDYRMLRGALLISTGRDEDIRKGELEFAGLVRDYPGIENEKSFRDMVTRVYSEMAANRFTRLGLARGKAPVDIPLYESTATAGDVTGTVKPLTAEERRQADQSVKDLTEKLKAGDLKGALESATTAAGFSDRAHAGVEQARIDVFLQGLKQDAAIAQKNYLGQDVTRLVERRLDYEKIEQAAGETSRQSRERNIILNVQRSFLKIGSPDKELFAQGKKEILETLERTPNLAFNQGFESGLRNAFTSHYKAPAAAVAEAPPQPKPGGTLADDLRNAAKANPVKPNQAVPEFKPPSLDEIEDDGTLVPKSVSDWNAQAPTGESSTTEKLIYLGLGVGAGLYAYSKLKGIYQKARARREAGEAGRGGEEGRLDSKERERLKSGLERETVERMDRSVKELAFSIKEGSVENIKKAMEGFETIGRELSGDPKEADARRLMEAELREAINDPKIKVRLEPGRAVQLEIDNQRLGMKLQFGNAETSPTLILPDGEGSKRIGPRTGSDYTDNLAKFAADIKAPEYGPYTVDQLDSAFQRNPGEMLDRVKEVSDLGIRTPAAVSDCLIEQAGFARALVDQPELLKEKMNAILESRHPERALEMLERSGVRARLFPDGDFSTPEKARQTLETFLKDGPSRGDAIAAKVARALSADTRVYNGEGVHGALDHLAETINKTNPGTPEELSRIAGDYLEQGKTFEERQRIKDIIEAGGDSLISGKTPQFDLAAAVEKSGELKPGLSRLVEMGEKDLARDIISLAEKGSLPDSVKAYLGERGASRLDTHLDSVRSRVAGSLASPATESGPGNPVAKIESTTTRHDTLGGFDVAGNTARDMMVRISEARGDGTTAERYVPVGDIEPRELEKRLAELKETDLTARIKATEDRIKQLDETRDRAEMERQKTELEGLRHLETMRTEYLAARESGQGTRYCERTIEGIKSGSRLGSVIKGAGPVVGVLLLFNALAPDLKSGGRSTERVRPTGN